MYFDILNNKTGHLTKKKGTKSWALTSKFNRKARAENTLWRASHLRHTHTLGSSMTRIRASDLVNDSICGQLITVVWLWLHLSNKATWTRGDPFKPRPLSCEELFFILLPIRALSPSAFLPSVHFQKGVIRMWPQPSAIHTGSHFPNGDYRVRRPPALTPDQHKHTPELLKP